MRKIFILMLFLFLSVSVSIADSIIIETATEDFVISLSEIDEITFSEDTNIKETVEVWDKIPISFVKNYPNPFSAELNGRQAVSATTISFKLKETGPTNVEIYNLKGQLVKTLVDRKLERGDQRFVWNARNENGKRVSTGVYFYKIQQRGKQITKKMLMIK